MARRLGELADRNLLHVEDPVRAALHFGLLVTADLPRPDRSRPPTQDETEATVQTGVNAFLNGLRALVGDV